MLILILDTILVTGESIQQFIMGLGQLCDIINYLHIIQLNPDNINIFKFWGKVKYWLEGRYNIGLMDGEICAITTWDRLLSCVFWWALPCTYSEECSRCKWLVWFLNQDPETWKNIIIFTSFHVIRVIWNPKLSSFNKRISSKVPFE